MSSSHLVADHTLTLLRNGEEYFPRLIAAMDGASHSIYLETYIFAADATGRSISDAMQRAARRGTSVHLLLDGFGSADLPQEWISEMRAAGVQVSWFRREIGRFNLRRNRLRRLHRKLAVVDNRIAFVSGINIINDLPGGRITAPRLDYSVEVQGSIVGQIHDSMQRLWKLVSWTSFRRKGVQARPHSGQKHPAQHKLTFLVRDNIRHRRTIERAYLKAIASAKSEIIIANAYFLPGRHLRGVLLKAAERGVRVVLLLQGRVEYLVQHFATLALYDELLSGGVEIHEYHASYLHAKVAVVDGHWATVGSSNIDPFSLWLAREANLEVRDAGFASALRASLLHDIASGARPVLQSIWRKHGLWMRLLMRLSYAVTRLLAGMVGYARDRDDI